MENVTIREGTIKEVVSASMEIPEFINPHQEEVYIERLYGCTHLILVAILKNKVIGFKVGYERDDAFYSWMGAVLPQYRNLSVAKRLATKQETWAKEMGYTKIVFKTRNRLKNMQIFALKNNFDIIEVVKKDSIDEYRIVMQKLL